jgi:prepilin-type N-terminal cleavage/methylation domain-containing protein
MSMSQVDTPHARLHDSDGFTLIELLVSMLIGLVVSLAAFSILDFTSSDVSRITARAHVDQTARVALEKIMLQLHSACVSVNVNPIQAKSTESKLRFVSETSLLNSQKEPTSSLSTVKLHEIIYTPASGKTAGTLTEKSWTSTGTNTSTGEYKFNEAEKPKEVKLLTGVTQTENQVTKTSIPVFQYYRYYVAGDSGTELGHIDPKAMSNGELEKENKATVPTTTEAEKVAKVTVTFTLAPEGYESALAKGDQPVALEDSTVLRFTPASEEAANTNYPCAQI